MAKKRKANASGGRGATVRRHTAPEPVFRPLRVIGPAGFNQHVDNLAAAAWDDYDRRQFRPDKSIRPPTTRRKAARIVQRRSPRVLGFLQPHLMALCHRRRIRTRVMHATGYAGKRLFPFKRPTLNFWSRISCKR